MTQKNTSEKSDVERAQNLLKFDTDAQTKDIQYLMEQVEFRRFMYGILSECHMYETSFTGNSMTFFKEGERAVGLRLMERLHTHCLDQYFAMLKEAKDRTEQT